MDDRWERFAEAVAFDDRRHWHFFSRGESKEKREGWLARTLQKAHDVGIECVVRNATSENGALGYEFGFVELADHDAFALLVLKDLDQTQTGPFSHAHSFEDCEKLYMESWRMAAETHLNALGIAYRSTMPHDGEVVFHFDRFSDRWLFQSMLKQGMFDASAHAIARVRSVMRRLDRSSTEAPTSPRPCFE